MQGKNSIEYLVYSIELRKRKKRQKKELEKISITDNVKHQLVGYPVSWLGKQKKSKPRAMLYFIFKSDRTKKHAFLFNA